MEHAQPSAEDEFVRLLTTHHDRLLRFVQTLVPNNADAEDIFQRASVTLWKKHAEFEADKDFFPWACRFLHFEVLNYRKRVARDRLTFSDDLIELMVEEQIGEQPDLDARRQTLDLCLEKLSDKDRKLLHRRYHESGTVADLAGDLNASPKQLYKTLERIRANLSRCLDAHTHHPSEA